MNKAQEAFEKYAAAVYPNLNLSPVQRKEIEQAFLSGIHWLLTEPMGVAASDADSRLQKRQLEKDVSNRLREIGSFPAEWN